MALGVSLVHDAEAVGRRGLLIAAIGGPGLLHAFVRGKLLINQHATADANMLSEAQRQAPGAVQVPATRHVLRMEARGRAQVAPSLHALHNMLLKFIAQCKALFLADALHRRM